MYGDWSQFLVIDRMGTQMLYEPLVKGTAGIGPPTGQSGWFYFWRVALDILGVSLVSSSWRSCCTSLNSFCASFDSPRAW